MVENEKRKTKKIDKDNKKTSNNLIRGVSKIYYLEKITVLRL